MGVNFSRSKTSFFCNFSRNQPISKYLVRLNSCEFSSDHSLRKHIAVKSEKLFLLKIERGAVLSLCWRHKLKFKSKAKPLRSSRSQMFFIMGALKNFSNLTGKRLGWSLFLIKLKPWRPATLLNRDSNTGVFLSNLQNF